MEAQVTISIREYDKLRTYEYQWENVQGFKDAIERYITAVRRDIYADRVKAENNLLIYLDRRPFIKDTTK